MYVDSAMFSFSTELNNSFLPAVVDIVLGWLRHFIGLLHFIVPGRDVWTRMASVGRLLLFPHRTLSAWIRGTGTNARSSDIATLSQLSKDAFLFDRAHGILTRLPPLSPFMSSRTSGDFPDLPFFKALLASSCLLLVVYRAYK